MRTYAYIDASNLFYGGEKSLGWNVDFDKLYKYLQDRFQVSQVFYFGGIETHKFPYDYLTNETVSLNELEKYLLSYYITNHKKDLSEAKLILFDRHLNLVHFYRKLEKFGYQLILKPVKEYMTEEGKHKRKANCDVEMAFYIMRDKNAFERVIVLSGDGDFLPVLKYLKEVKKEVLILARGSRTAKEIKKFAGDKFMDFTLNLQSHLERLDS